MSWLQLVAVAVALLSARVTSANNILTTTPVDFGPTVSGGSSPSTMLNFQHLGSTPSHTLLKIEKIGTPCSHYDITGATGYPIDGAGNFTSQPVINGTIVFDLLVVTFRPTIVAASFDCMVLIHQTGASPIIGMVLLQGSSFAGSAPEVNVPMTSLDLGMINVTQTGGAQLTIENTGNAALNYSFSIPPGTEFSTTQCQTNCTLGGGTMTTHPITFSPMTAGMKMTTLTITSNDSDEMSIPVMLTGTGLSGGNSGMVNPTTGELAFGNVPVGTTATKPFSIANAGTADVTLTAASFGSPVFAVGATTPLPITIGPGNAAIVELTCTPSGRSSYSAVATVMTTAGNGNVNVSLSCKGAAEVTLPASIDFGVTQVGVPVHLDDAIDLHNINHTASFVVREVRLDDASGVFAIDVPTGSLAPDAHLLGAATFTPALAGRFEARASVYLDTDPAVHGEIVMTGHAVALEAEGGCATHQGAGWAIVAIVLVLATTRRRGFALIAVLVVPAAARADVVMQTAQPPVSIEDRFFQIEAASVAPTSWALGLALGYARDPFRLALTDCGSECPPGLVEGDTTPIIHSQGLAVLGASYAQHERFELGLSVPLVAQSGRDSPFMEAASGIALGDITARGKVRLWSSRAVVLGAGAMLSAPTATSGQYTGSDGPTARAVGRATYRAGALRIAVEAGALVRKTSTLGTLHQGSAIDAGLGALYAVTPSVRVSGEVFGAAGLVDGSQTVVQSLAGVRATVAADLEIGVAGGVSVVSGAGVPSVRGLLVVVYSPRAELPPPRGAAVVTPPPPIEIDPPPPATIDDPDHDGIAGAQDGCPTEPEDKDAFKDDDGCPDGDNDGDGVADAADACPNAAGALDGCPDDDSDKDGVPDGFDKCSGQAETINGNADDDGCPDAGDSLVLVGKSRIDLFDAIRFTNEVELDPASANVVAQLALALRADRSIAKLQIIVHVHAQDAVDTDRSRRRASAIVDALVKRGVPGKRLEAVGAGRDKPLNAATPSAPINDRVELVITSRSTSP